MHTRDEAHALDNTELHGEQVAAPAHPLGRSLREGRSHTRDERSTEVGQDAMEKLPFVALVSLVAVSLGCRAPGGDEHRDEHHDANGEDLQGRLLLAHDHVNEEGSPDELGLVHQVEGKGVHVGRTAPPHMQ